ncbi:MAG TPA: SPFH domain-containing protein [Pyrinomonadaceae bacterium]|nr:SPFH domain-containing protein [Pyrinomonadaceae bacterium]
MPAQLIGFIFTAIALVIIAAKSVVITKEGERLVVYRLGKLLHVYPPGLKVMIPFIDKAVRVQVGQIAGWQTLRENELVQRIVEAEIKK